MGLKEAFLNPQNDPKGGHPHPACTSDLNNYNSVRFCCSATEGGTLPL